MGVGGFGGARVVPAGGIALRGSRSSPSLLPLPGSFLRARHAGVVPLRCHSGAPGGATRGRICPGERGEARGQETAGRLMRKGGVGPFLATVVCDLVQDAVGLLVQNGPPSAGFSARVRT